MPVIVKLTQKCILLLTIFPLFWISCHESEDLSEYYFSDAAQVYVYEPVTGTVGERSYWQYIDTMMADQKTLICSVYNASRQRTQVSYEHVHTQGVVQDSLFFMGSDTAGQFTAAMVGPGAVFPFYRAPFDTLLYKMQWTDSRDSMEYTLSRHRCYTSDTLWSYRGRVHPAVIFVLKEELESFRHDLGKTESEWSGYEVYAKGLGLVYYKKVIGPDFVRAAYLSNITKKL